MSIKVKAVERNVSFDKSKEESYSYFHDGLALQGKGLGVAVFVDLCKSLLGCLVKLQFQYKYVWLRFNCNVGSSFSRALLHKDVVVGEKGEHKVEHF